MSETPLQTERKINYAERKTYIYVCSQCNHETECIFFAEAEAPASWECKLCQHTAFLKDDLENTESLKDGEHVRNVPLEILLERRSKEELETLLEQRLAYLRNKQHKS